MSNITNIVHNVIPIPVHVPPVSIQRQSNTNQDTESNRNRDDNTSEQSNEFNVIPGNECVFINNDEDSEDSTSTISRYCQNCKRHECNNNSSYDINLEACEKKDIIKRKKFKFVEKHFGMYNDVNNDDEYLLCIQCRRISLFETINFHSYTNVCGHLFIGICFQIKSLFSIIRRIYGN